MPCLAVACPRLGPQVVHFSSATSIVLARLNKVQAESPFRPHHLQCSEPPGMRALASHSQKAGGGEWQWKAPRENLSCSLRLPRHGQSCTKRHKHHARIGPRFHLFHPGLACNRRMFSRWHLSFFQEQNIPLWHFLGAKGCKGDLPSGGMQHPSKLCLHCLTTDMPLASFVQSVERVVQREGTFPRHAWHCNN